MLPANLALTSPAARILRLTASTDSFMISRYEAAAWGRKVWLVRPELTLVCLSGDEHGFRIWSNHHCWNIFRHSVLRSGLVSQRTQGFSGETTKAMISTTSHQYCVTWDLLLHVWRRPSCCHVPTGSMQGQYLPWSGHLCQGLWKEQWTPQRLHPDFWDRSCLHPHW